MTDMARIHGRCRSRARRRMGMPLGHGKATTFVAGLATRGMAAPFMSSGPFNRSSFEVGAERALVPELCPDDVVIVDDLSSDRGPRTRALIEAAGARLPFPASFSPELNPVEGATSKPKALPRKVPERAVEGRWAAIGRIVELFTPAECASQFSAGGYDPV